MVVDTRLTFDEFRADLLALLQKSFRAPLPPPPEKVARRMWEDGLSLGDICKLLGMELSDVYQAINGSEE